MGIKLNEGDLKYVSQIHNAVTKAVSGMPHELMSNGRFGAWTVTAVTNILCSMFKLMKLDKNKAYQLLDDIWDKQDTVYKVLN